MPLGVNEYRIGILFKRLEEQDKKEIISFINRTPHL
jgi:ribosomal protein L12E/L44/L45/RPP1/RPP2